MPSATSSSERDLAAFPRDPEVAAVRIRPGVPTPTVPDAARGLGVTPDAVVDSLSFQAAAYRSPTTRRPYRAGA
jgi:hypothetical protein